MQYPDLIKCKKCGFEKPHSEYSWRLTGPKTGSISEYKCKKCKAAHGVEYYADPDIKKRVKEYYTKPDIKKRKLERLKTIESKYKQCKATAKKRNIFFNLSFEYYKSIIIVNDKFVKCYYCNDMLGSINTTGGSLDRINNDHSIGYVEGNVLPCCGACNGIRGNILTVEEMIMVIKYLLDIREKTKHE